MLVQICSCEDEKDAREYLRRTWEEANWPQDTIESYLKVHFDIHMTHASPIEMSVVKLQPLVTPSISTDSWLQNTANVYQSTV